ncbi:hypothetical protein Tco_0218661 [Tanacetum coccineum]
MVTSMEICHVKPYTLRDGPLMKLEQRLFKAWQLNNHSKNSLISSKPDRAYICTIKYHKTVDCYGINSQSDYSSYGCEDSFLECTNQVQVHLTKELFSYKFFIKDMGEADVILVSTPIDISEKLMPNNGQAISQLEYSRVIGYLMYAMTCTRPDIAFAVGKLSGYSSNHGYTDASWIRNTEDNSSTSGWVFLLGGAVGKEAEWLRNLILEIPLWSKPIAPISILYNSVATLIKAYSQMYNGKSRHLGVRHSMIRELIRNGVISIEFVRSQRNLVDHLTKGLARDLVLKSAEGMSLKSNQVVEC